MEFIPIIEHVYGPDNLTESELRGVLSRFAIKHLLTLKESQRFHKILKQFPDFVYDFSTLMMEKGSSTGKELW